MTNEVTTTRHIQFNLADGGEEDAETWGSWGNVDIDDRRVNRLTEAVENIFGSRETVSMVITFADGSRFEARVDPNG